MGEIIRTPVIDQSKRILNGEARNTSDMISRSELDPNPQRSPSNANVADEDKGSAQDAQDVRVTDSDSERGEYTQLRREIEREVRLELEEEAKAILNKAQADGIESGRRLSEEQVEAAVLELQNRNAEQVGNLLVSLETKFNFMISTLEDGIPDIVLAAVCKILGDVLVTRDGVEAAVKSVVKDLNLRRPLTVGVSAAEYDHMKKWFPSQFAGLDVRVMADDRVALGGCIVDTGSGILDGRVETALQRLREILIRTRDLQ